MKKMPTWLAEKVYDVLVKFAEASHKHYDRESFIYHFGVVSGTADEYRLSCLDDSTRTFTCTKDGQMWLEGKGSNRVNAILEKLSTDLKKETFQEFTITKNEV